ncbi:MAG: FAD/NAD(P)-binding oxidoreductase [Acidimicrobiales bacterium]
MNTTTHHRIVVIGGGTAGITVAARLGRAGQADVAIVEPSGDHYYQPLWTIVGGGAAKLRSTRRDESAVIPRGVTWLRSAATDIDPENKVVTTAVGDRVGYDALVVCPGLKLDFDRTPGLAETIGRNGTSSNYRYDLAPVTWDNVRNLRRGTAVFTMPTGPIKCGGAPQKAAYMSADHWRREGVLDAIDVHLVVPGPEIFGIEDFAVHLREVVADYGITLHTRSEMTAVDGDARRATITNLDDGSTTELDYDMLHAVPHQSAPSFISAGPLADDTGWVDVDRETLRHVRHDDVWSLGDVSSTPNAKTGAAVRKQAPVVVENLLAGLEERAPTAAYHGYSSCPLITAKGKVLLAEFDYDGKPTPTFPVIDTTKPRRDMWYLKRYGLPWLYWNLMLKGRA